MPPGNPPREPAGAGSRTGTAYVNVARRLYIASHQLEFEKLMPSSSAVFHLDTTNDWVYLIWKDDSERIPLPQTSQDGKEQTRRKFFLMIQYILELRQVAATTTYEKQCRKQYTPIDEFFKEHDILPEQQKHRFALNAETLFLVRLGQARDAAQARAGELGLKITRLLVPFPSAWTRLMQQYYAAYFRITWKLDPEFIYESEAIAHLVVSKSMMPGFQGETFRTLIVVDLGAHILSVSTFHLAIHRTNPATFHLYSEPNYTSVPSGIDLHAKRMDSIIGSYMDDNCDSLSKLEKEKLGKKFTASYMQHCDAMVKGDAFIMCAASSTIHQIPVSDEKSRSMYNECFSNVFETLRKALNASEANKRADKTKVVLVGVGFQNMSLRKKVKKQVKSRGFLLHDFKDFCLDITHIVAVGAASAIVNASTVEQFMQGARFVVQGSSGTTTSSATIWSSGSSRTAQVSVLEADETLIVKCSPVPKTSRASGIDATLFYDFSELKLPRGNYRIRMEPPVPSANGYSITISYTGISSHADDGRETRDGSRDYGIYYDYGSRLCFEDIDKSASRDKNNQATKDWEELEKLLYVTDEALEATVLARTKYRTVAKRRATLPAL